MFQKNKSNNIKLSSLVEVLSQSLAKSTDIKLEDH